MKRAVISTKKHVNLDYLKQPDIGERCVKTILEKLKNLDLNSTNSVMNDHLISFINSATEETLLMQEKTGLYWPWDQIIILKDLYNLKDLQIARSGNSN